MLEGFLTDSSAGDHKQQSRMNIGATLTRLALSLTLSLVSSDRRPMDQRSRSPKSAGCIIAMSGRRPEKVIDNTGRMKFGEGQVGDSRKVPSRVHLPAKA
jgi:hypothetical protein